jgi:hypothetical protein
LRCGCIARNCVELSTTGDRISSEAADNSSTFYGTRRFITAFSTALHLSLFRVRQLKSTSGRPVSTRSILLVSILLAIPPVTYTRSFSPHSCYMLSPCHNPRLDHSNYIWWRRRIQRRSFSLCCFQMLVSIPQLSLSIGQNKLAQALRFLINSRGVRL